jgi:PAS domain S-box-containing protein
MNKPVPEPPAAEPMVRGAIAREPSETALRLTEQRLEFTLRAARLGSWDFDVASGSFTSSAHSREIFGLGPDDPFERYEDVVARVHPDDRAHRQAAIDRALSLGEELDIEYRTLRPDGQVGWILARGRAVFEDGRAVRMAGISLDITERKAADERQKLLLDELNHRVKNTLATVQSIAMQTIRNAKQPSLFDMAFVERLHALAQAHDLLTEASWEGASLADVIERTLRPRAPLGEDHRVGFTGPPVRLSPNAAVTLNMVFHELATNAARYGALSAPEGRVDVTWALDRDTPVILLEWLETGGPPAAAPARRGFGSRLIEQALPREMGGEAHLSFLPAGLRCHMRMPLSDKLSLLAP